MQDILESCKGQWLFGCPSSVILTPRLSPPPVFNCLRQGKPEEKAELMADRALTVQARSPWFVTACMPAFHLISAISFCLVASKSLCTRLINVVNITMTHNYKMLYEVSYDV